MPSYARAYVTPAQARTSSPAATAPPRGQPPRPAPRPHHPQAPADALGAQLARAVQQRGAAGVAPAVGLADGPVIQRWWAGIRQLAHMGWLGPPFWLGGNFFYKGGYHQHIFLEDGGSPADVGHMPDGLLTDVGHTKREYTKTHEGYDDATMRMAIRKHDPPPKYELTGNNCQRWASSVLETYKGLGGRINPDDPVEMSVLHDYSGQV